MDGAELSPYPHHSWLAHWLTVRPPRVFEVYEERRVTHRLFLTTSGEAQVIWTSQGVAVPFHATTGDIAFYPCDHAVHEFAITTTTGYRAYAMFLPVDHLADLGAADGVHPGTTVQAVPVLRDAVLHASLMRLAGGGGSRLVSEEIGDEIAARQVVMRLCMLTGGRIPDWRRDTSVFPPPVMRQIVERVDGLLGSQVSLAQVSDGFGLSPSHFARKFQQSAGVSLNRFINRRRISRSLARLSLGEVSLPQLSLELGFCSQSHFTRVFSRLTGITPFQFSRVYRGFEE